MVFVQSCEVRPITVVVDYKPRRLNVASLRAGNLAEVMNMTVWSDVRVVLPMTRVTGLQGWHAVGSSIIQAYIQDVISSQVICWSMISLSYLLVKCLGRVCVVGEGVWAQSCSNMGLSFSRHAHGYHLSTGNYGHTGKFGLRVSSFLFV